MKLSAGVLAGGRSLRMGRDKAFLDAGGIPLIDYVLRRLEAVSEDRIIASRDPAKFQSLGARSVADALDPPCALAGIHAVLQAAREPVAFVTAVDMPYVNPELIAHLADKLEAFDAVLPEGEAGIEPLCGIYTRACLAPFAAALSAGRLKITDALAACNPRILTVRESDWRVCGASPFTNINRPGDFQEFLRRLAT